MFVKRMGRMSIIVGHVGCMNIVVNRMGSMSIIVPVGITCGIHMAVRLTHWLLRMRDLFTERDRFVQETLELIVAFGHPFESIPGSDGTQGAFHMSSEDLQAVDVRCVDPTETKEDVNEEGGITEQ